MRASTPFESSVGHKITSHSLGSTFYRTGSNLDFGQFGRGLARHSPEKSSTERSFVTSQRHGDMRKVRRCTGRTVRRSDHRGPGRIQGPSRTRLEDVHSTSRPPRRSRSCLSIIPAPDARQVTHKIGQSRDKKTAGNRNGLLRASQSALSVCRFHARALRCERASGLVR